MPPAREEEVARQCVAVDAALPAAELHAAACDEPLAPQVPHAERALSARALERACASLLHSPDARLAARVSRLADAHLRAPDAPMCTPVFDALCAYGALAPPHDAIRLRALFVVVASLEPARLAKAAPAVIALAHADPLFSRLIPPLATLARDAVERNDADEAELVASAVLAVVDAHDFPLAADVRADIRAARDAARDAGLALAQQELERVLLRH